MAKNTLEILSIYNIMGEGFVVEMLEGDETKLFDRQGLQHRIIERGRLGMDTSKEERALAQINSFGPYYGLSEISNK